MNEHKILIGNAFNLIKDLDDKSIDCVMTSPPYWGLRDYDHPNQFGHEETPEEYIEKLVNFFDDVKDKLKDKGTCWVNLGDTYSGGQPGQGGTGKKSYMHKNQIKESQHFNKIKINYNLPSKCVCMIPERFAWEMIRHGWLLRNKIIWHKPNHMPESVTDRFTKSYEYLFFFVKQNKYDFDLDVVRERHKTGTRTGFNLSHGYTDGIHGKNPGDVCKTKSEILRDTNKNIHHQDGYVGDNPKGKNPGDIWSINTKPYPGSHFAVFPLELIEKPILAGCLVDGVVLDPFGGSGTVAEFCSNNHRNSITFELNEDYKNLIEERLKLKPNEDGVYIKRNFEDW